MRCILHFHQNSSDATGADPVLLHGPDFPDYRLILVLMVDIGADDKMDLVIKVARMNL